MRISDWSSDVCSSDLDEHQAEENKPDYRLVRIDKRPRCIQKNHCPQHCQSARSLMSHFRNDMNHSWHYPKETKTMTAESSALGPMPLNLNGHYQHHHGLHEGSATHAKAAIVTALGEYFAGLN